MVDMAKLKEDALRRKQEHEEKELKRQMQRRKSAAPRKKNTASSRTAQRPAARGARTQVVQAQPKKRKRSISRWVLDILLVLGALLVMVMFINPF